MKSVVPQRALLLLTFCAMTLPARAQTPPGTIEQRCTTAYRSLDSLECIITREARSGGTPTRVLFQFRRPNRVRLLVLSSDGARQLISNGSSGVEIDREGAVTSLPAAELSLAGMLESAGLKGSRLAGALAADPAPPRVPGPPQRILVAGVPVFRLTTDQGTLDIAERDSLLRQWTDGAVTERYTAVRVNSPLSDVLFTPPANRGARFVRSTLAPPPSPVPQPASLPDPLPATAAPANAAIGSVPPLSERFDLGTIDPVTTGTITHDFRLTNTTDRPQTITRLVASCGCVSAMIGEGPSPAKRGPLAVLPPGGSTTVGITVNLDEVHTEQMRKSVAVYTAESPRPIARFEITAVVPPSITVTPVSQDFHDVPVGASPAQTLTLTLDERLLIHGQPPRLEAASEPRVHIGEPEPVPMPVLGKKAYRYRVSLETAQQLGRLGLLLTPIVPESMSPSTALPADRQEDRRRQLLRALKIPLAARIVGAVQAQPDMIYFGSLPAGEASTQKIRVAYQNALDRKSRKITCSHSALTTASGHLEPASDREEVLEITVHTAGLAGPFTATVRVTLANGQQLLIPVSAFVRKAGISLPSSKALR